MSTPRPDRSSSSLSESWATLSASDIHSEDDTHSIQTDNASLVGASAPEDVASLADHEEEQSDGEQTDADSHCSEARDYLQRVYRDEQSDRNNLMETASFISTADPIIFEEPGQWPASGLTELKYTLCTIDDTSPEDSLKDRAELTAAVRLTASQEGLRLDRPFRVLYSGSSRFKSPVLDKLGDVLVANSKTITPSSSADSSRFHVVPTAFGPDASPNYAELLPLHVQLTVDECTAAYEDFVQPDRITLILKNGDRHSSYRVGTDYTISSTSEWALPDLAIFFLAESETSAQLARRYVAYYFMRRHGVPCLFISEKPLWGGEYPAYPVDSRVVHVAIEERHASSPNVTVIGRCPIDLSTFENICPEQLNRNLSAVINTSKLALAPSKGSKEVHTSHDIEKYPKNSPLYQFVHSVYEPNPVLKHVTMVIVGLITMSLGYAGIKYLTALFLQYLGYFTVSSSLEAATAPRTTVWSTAERMSITPQMLAGDVAIGTCSGESSLAINDYIAKISRPILDESIDSGMFQVRLLGDCHLIIRAPSTTRWRKSSKFGIKVVRGGEELPYVISRLFDGVHALRLDRENAYGVMRVTITTKAKPIFEQVTEVDFGSPWLKVANWQRAAQSLSSRLFDELIGAQASISKTFSRIAVHSEAVVDALQEVLKAYISTLQRGHDITSSLTMKPKQWYEDMQRDVPAVIQSTTALLSDRAKIVQTDLSAYARNIWKAMGQQAKTICGTTPKLMISDIGLRVRDMRKSRALAAAQEHARGLSHWRQRKNPPADEKGRMGRTTSR